MTIKNHSKTPLGVGPILPWGGWCLPAACPAAARRKWCVSYCRPICFLFLDSVFSAFPAFPASASVLLCFSVFLLFVLLCFSAFSSFAFLLFLLLFFQPLCFSVFVCLSYISAFPLFCFCAFLLLLVFLQSRVFAALLLPAPLLLCFLYLLSLCFSASFALFFPACILTSLLSCF